MASALRGAPEEEIQAHFRNMIRKNVSLKDLRLPTKPLQPLQRTVTVQNQSPQVTGAELFLMDKEAMKTEAKRKGNAWSQHHTAADISNELEELEMLDMATVSRLRRPRVLSSSCDQNE